MQPLDRYSETYPGQSQNNGYADRDHRRWVRSEGDPKTTTSMPTTPCAKPASQNRARLMRPVKENNMVERFITVRSAYFPFYLPPAVPVTWSSIETRKFH